MLCESGNRQKMNIEMNIYNHNSYLLVDRALLRQNAQTIIAGLGEKTELIPVLKDDAYGLGLVPVTRALCEDPRIRILAVAHVSEGLQLREAGIDREILVMGGALPFQLEAGRCDPCHLLGSERRRRFHRHRLCSCPQHPER